MTPLDLFWYVLAVAGGLMLAPVVAVLALVVIAAIVCAFVLLLGWVATR